MKKSLVALALIAASGLALATGNHGGGEGNNTNCNGKGNPNSPCAGNGGNGGNGGQGGNGGNGGTGQGGAGGTGHGGQGGTGVGVGVGQGGNATGGRADATATGGAVLGSGNSSLNSNIKNSNDIKNTVANANLQGQQQGQGQSQGIKNSGNSASNSRSGVKDSGNGTGTASVGDINITTAPSDTGTRDLQAPDQTSIDASDRSTTEYRAIVIPSVVPATPPSSVGNSEIVKETSACGPLQTVVRVPVIGTFHGMFTNTTTEQGTTDALDPNGYVDPVTKQTVAYRTIGDRLFGHQVTQFTSVVGTSGARNIAIGGGSSTGSWGQGGGGASSAMQQMVTTIQLRLCEIGTVRLEKVPAPIIREVPAKPNNG